jgi:hypothetical protein
LVEYENHRSPIVAGDLNQPESASRIRSLNRATVVRARITVPTQVRAPIATAGQSSHPNRLRKTIDLSGRQTTAITRRARVMLKFTKQPDRTLGCMALILIMASLGEAVSPIRSMPENSSVADV